ncbi:MAG: hypothetical protein KF851_04150 [Pirellulaceae bacterium]|nr:hypothetical protein [Pirellulaceae bacterium]
MQSQEKIAGPESESESESAIENQAVRPKLIDIVRGILRMLHYAKRTE